MTVDIEREPVTVKAGDRIEVQIRVATPTHSPPPHIIMTRTVVLMPTPLCVVAGRGQCTVSCLHDYDGGVSAAGAMAAH